MFHKDFLLLMRNPQVTACCFIRGLTVMFALFPKFKIFFFFKTLNLDLLEIT